MSVKKAVKCYPCLCKLAKAKSSIQRKKILRESPKLIYAVITDIAKQVLKGVIPIEKKKKSQLKRYKNQLRKLTTKLPSKQKQKIINQQGGFLPLLIKPALSVLAALATERLMRK